MIPSMPAREMEMKKAGALKRSTLQIENRYSQRLYHVEAHRKYLEN